MRLTTHEIEKILNTLPIGYYVKREVKVKLDENAPCSYYDPMHDSICISSSQLNNALDNLKNSENVEDDIRTILYHEVSHAFITPKCMKVTRERNIFEDERIESVLRKYYRRVNFREFVKRINNFHGEQPKSADDAYYQLVRYRVGNPEWLEKLHQLILKWSNIGRLSDWYYCLDIDDFYRSFCEWWNNQKEAEQQNPQPENSTSNEQDEQTDESDESNETEESNESNETEESDEYQDFCGC